MGTRKLRGYPEIHLTHLSTASVVQLGTKPIASWTMPQETTQPASQRRAPTLRAMMLHGSCLMKGEWRTSQCG